MPPPVALQQALKDTAFIRDFSSSVVATGLAGTKFDEKPAMTPQGSIIALRTAEFRNLPVR